MNGRVVINGVLLRNLIRVHGSISFALVPQLAWSRYYDFCTCLHEVWEHAFPTPSRVSESLPGIVVIGATPIPAHSIQDTTTTEHLALRHGPSVAIQLCLRYRDEVPVVNATDVGTNVDGILNDFLVLVTMEISNGN